jgi:hypothetical protein
MECVSKSTGMHASQKNGTPALMGVPFFKQPPNYGGKKKNTGNIPANYTKKMGPCLYVLHAYCVQGE